MQYICENKNYFTNDTNTLNFLINRIETESHPKVVRWIAYTLAKLYSIKHISLGDDIVKSLKRKALYMLHDKVASEWLVASIEAIERIYYSVPYPMELDSIDDISLGVVKSWSYSYLKNKYIDLLVKALNHSDDFTRKWAALSLGNSKEIDETIKNRLLNVLDDPSSLVREWAVYAVRNSLNEKDFKLIKNKLDMEDDVRVREWLVKSIPYTLHDNVYDRLIEEIGHGSYQTDDLYAEAVLNALFNYTDIHGSEQKMLDIISNEKRDIVILAAMKNVYKSNKRINDFIIEIYIDALEKTKYDSVKQQILYYLYNSVSEKKKKLFDDLRGLENNLLNYKFINGIISNNKLLNQYVSDETRSNKTNLFFMEVSMRDQFNVENATVVGPNAKVTEALFNNNVKTFDDGLDFIELCEDLQFFRTEYLKTKKDLSPDDTICLAEIAQAEKACQDADKNKVLQCLKSVGKWAIDFSTLIGADVLSGLLLKILEK